MKRTAHDVRKLLLAHYCPPEWAYFEEVASKTGHGANRRADGVAMNLWPSRGLGLVGLEIKVSRQDWKKELEHPEKVEEGVFRYCDGWYVVEGNPGVVRGDELPSAWGLIRVVEGRKGSELQFSVTAPVLTPKELDRKFVASLLRRASQWMATGVANTETYQKGLEEGRKVAEAVMPSRMAALQGEVGNLRQWKKEFEELIGVSIPDYEMPSFIRAVKVAKKWYFHPDIVPSLEGVINMAKKYVKDLGDMKQALATANIPKKGSDG